MGKLLNGHTSTADTCDITDNFECPDCIYIDFEFNIFKPLNSGHPAIPYNGHYFGPIQACAIVNILA